jgi:hypothetical protein
MRDFKRVVVEVLTPSGHERIDITDNPICDTNTVGQIVGNLQRQGYLTVPNVKAKDYAGRPHPDAAFNVRIILIQRINQFWVEYDPAIIVTVQTS